MSTTLKGRVRIAVREGGEIVKDYGWQDNLILDQGLDKIATMAFNQVFTACCCGTGSNPTGRNPNATATIAGTTLTASTATFTSADLDTDCVFASLGLRFKIQSIVSPTQVTLFTSGNVATASAFTMEYTNQAILEGEVKRSAIYLDTPGGNGYLINPGSIVLWRTFLFTPETTEVTYTELGFSDQDTAGPNLFSRVVLATPVSLIGPQAALPTGQQLQVTYQLTIGIDYGKGPGNFFSGRTTVPVIAITNLPILFSIWQYADSTTLPGNLAVTMAGNVPALVGESVVVAGASLANYNGTWQVLDSTQITDPTHGVSTTLSLAVPWTAAATGGTVTIPLSGGFFRGNADIWVIGSVGQQSPPPNTSDFFQGLGEPSVAGQAWASSIGGPQITGGNNAPSAIDPSFLSTVACVLQPYTPGSFYRDRIADIIIANSPTVSAFGYGIADLTNQIETWVWDQPHLLQVGSTLALTFRVSWGRTPQ